jgi:hypothetical protein
MLDKVRATLASDDLLGGVTIPKNSEFANIIQMCSGGLLQVVEQQHHDGQINSVVGYSHQTVKQYFDRMNRDRILVDRFNGEKLNMVKVIEPMSKPCGWRDHDMQRKESADRDRLSHDQCSPVRMFTASSA